MKKTLLSCSIYMLSFISFAQYPTVPGTFNVSAYEGSNMYTNSGSIKAEIPPWTIAGGWHTYIFHDGSNTVTYSVPNALAPKTAINCQGHGPYFANGPIAADPWKRNYSGIYSAHYLTHPTAGTIDIGFCHNENKNICNGAQNTIDTHIGINCAIPYQGYFAFVSAVWTPSTQANNWGQTGYNNDLGPILWPGSAYVASNYHAATQGLLQPSSIVYNNYIYIFIWDKGPLPDGPQNNPGITRGIKLVRVPVSGSLDPSQYQVYYKDLSGNVNWLPSLPAGFTKSSLLNYVGIKGPLSTDILSDQIPNNTECFRFTAAQVNGTNYFVGLEEYVDNNDMNTTASSTPEARHHVALRFSYDLINWSPRVQVIETSANWDASAFNYPIMLSSDGWTNTAVNLSQFYVVGTYSHSPFQGALSMLTINYSGLAPYTMHSMPQTETTGIFSAETGTIDGVFPNPTQGLLKLNYTIAASARVQTMVYDVTGRRLQTGLAAWREAGSYAEDLDLSRLSGGVYFVELVANNEKKTYKVVVR